MKNIQKFSPKKSILVIRLMVLLSLSLITANSYADRHVVCLNKNWSFRFSHQVNKGSERRVDLPHTWNAQDAISGKPDYKRGIGNYEKKIFIKPEYKGKRLFLRFEGANTVASVFINRKYAGEHRGGYGAFVIEITDKVNYGKDNSILVRVNNAEQLDIMPLLGDFNMYGGIYRDVHLVVTEDICISPLDYASSGIKLIQDYVSNEYAKVRAVIQLSSKRNCDTNLQVRVRVMDGSKLVKEITEDVLMPLNTCISDEISFDLKKPHLWNGKDDPFLYRVEVSLLEDGKTIDSLSHNLGLRYYSIDPDKGFFLNGKHLQLKGVCRHQERAEVGNALRKEHHDEDIKLMLEMGVNAVRLAHYPQAEYIYDLMDKNGIIVWAEIPFVGPGGYEDKGFVDSEMFKENGKQQLVEMIRQHYNHPSICFWGLFNELKEYGDNPIEYIKELNEIAHNEDPTRPTTSASNQGGAINYITDVIAWNRYDGWYGGNPGTLGVWLDDLKKKNPNIRVGISEYGAGASIYHQQEELKQPNPSGWWHPENWQTYYHIENWKIISSRPFVWGSFVWNMFDFGAAHRTEGDRPGINDKGLVTFDRKIRKDAFYFYKANWNKSEPVLHIAGKRCDRRTSNVQTIMAFTNQPEAELFVNGKSFGKVKADEYCIVKWENIVLNNGYNDIEVEISNRKIKLSDRFLCYVFGD